MVSEQQCIYSSYISLLIFFFFSNVSNGRGRVLRRSSAINIDFYSRTYSDFFTRFV
ncbi:hypothetical protein Lalb_Chr14g0364661 [Lupinus albus]|uniref:Uncharacterized protein n=1 Tax=Lupinus albus TaxID=3870 RepID=A0A6A4PBI1_LUPAL|nr:hypothetical protein Lalb_Chr14g0364661 [Lupinus albus]